MDYLVSPDWLEDNRSHPDLRILDCTVVFERTDGILTVEGGLGRWASGHIPGSHHLDLLEDLADPMTELRFMMPPIGQIVSVLEPLGVGEGTRVVLYDSDKNMWAARVWWMLRSLGFDDAAVLDGGLKRWASEGRLVSTVPSPKPPRARFVPRPQSGFFVDKAEVLAAIQDDDTCIVNALSQTQHNGENDDYGRRGHIPGALNVPAASLVDDDTHAYIAPEKLRERFSHVLDSGATKTITYCGGGISASSNAFVLSLLGVNHVAIYDASMGEWGYDHSLPLVDRSAE